jgi:hypothetical protein
MAADADVRRDIAAPRCGIKVAAAVGVKNIIPDYQKVSRNDGDAE